MITGRYIARYMLRLLDMCSDFDKILSKCTIRCRVYIVRSINCYQKLSKKKVEPHATYFVLKFVTQFCNSPEWSLLLSLYILLPSPKFPGGEMLQLAELCLRG